MKNNLPARNRIVEKSKDSMCMTLLECPICKRVFVHKPHSIYISHNKNNKVEYCRYNCWCISGNSR